MILSASGWRKVFAESGDGEDLSPDIGYENSELCALIADTFADYITEKAAGKPVVVVARDTRPTGEEITDCILRVLIAREINVRYLGIASAPEIMAYARSFSGFVYISASHNPVGHNGIKFGLNDGGVIPGPENARLVEEFLERCASPEAEENAQDLLHGCDERELQLAYTLSDQYKKESLWVYEDFLREVIAGSKDPHIQDEVFSIIRANLQKHPLGITADMNGSARTRSVDDKIIMGTGINFLPFNNDPGIIAHAIIPEPENLKWCAEVMEDLHKDGDEDTVLGYMPDCDGDRGNIVYWDTKSRSAKTIEAQDVFALSVIAETAFEIWKKNTFPQKSLLWKAMAHYGKTAVVVNGPTSMRIDQICRAFKMSLFRAEVGEANVVNLAREKRNDGYSVRILGEGSNGGNITYPSSVRDPIATVFAIVKLLTIRDRENEDGSVNMGPFHLWCKMSDQEYKFRKDFTMADIMATLPEYTTTGVSEESAILQVDTEDKGILKEHFQEVFDAEWDQHLEEMQAIYSIYSYRVFATNGTVERELKDGESWNNGNGGLKIQFYDQAQRPFAFIWMRPSGTEPVFRVMCDVRGDELGAERSLLRWETSMIRKADKMVS